jgi:hypothetical protein
MQLLLGTLKYNMLLTSLNFQSLYNLINVITKYIYIYIYNEKYLFKCFLYFLKFDEFNKMKM